MGFLVLLSTAIPCPLPPPATRIFMPKLLNTAYPAAFATVCFALGCALYRRASVASAVLRMSARSSSGVAAATLIGADRIASSIMPTIDFIASPPLGGRWAPLQGSIDAPTLEGRQRQMLFGKFRAPPQENY